ncbi:MAG: tryptophan--tRNA ligase [Candidatus Pacebacteria bacterium]|nr:tryptophan--tRNA ligase [Candidatus Paceibacterota bacterium]
MTQTQATNYVKTADRATTSHYSKSHYSRPSQSKAQSNQKWVFSGTRATGRLHLGNYLGAVKGYIELQNNPEYECLYMVVDLHTVTTPYNQHDLPQATREIILDYLAAGLDPDKAIITAQSLVPEHTYLAFLFSSVMTVARMQHLPTYKDKVEQHPDNVTMALLNYPVLMAADILLYHAQLVPVGIDQEPHLEVAREIARKMNDRFGTDFPEPQRFVTPGQYIPSIKGQGKMSKSVEGSYINLTDDLETIKQRLAGAPTDSGQGQIKLIEQDSDQPRTSVSSTKLYLDQSTGESSVGVANLMQLVELFEGEATRLEYEQLYQTTGLRYGELKQQLAEAIYQELEPIQQRRQELEAQPELIEEIIQAGAKQARSIAKPNLELVKHKMGFRF